MLADSLHKLRGPWPRVEGAWICQGQPCSTVCLASGFSISPCASFSSGLIVATEQSKEQLCPALFTFFPATCPERGWSHLYSSLFGHPPFDLSAASISALGDPPCFLFPRIPAFTPQSLQFTPGDIWSERHSSNCLKQPPAENSTQGLP